MTLDKAHALSRDLAADGFAHTIEVGVYDNEVQSVQARVDLRLRRIRGGTIGHAVAILETIATRHGLQLDSSLVGDGLTFNTPDVARRLDRLTEIAKDLA